MLHGVTDLASAHAIHPAWWVAAVTFLALVGAAGFRAVPGVFMDPLHEEFGWSVTTISLAAVSVNMALYGLTSPFAAALMERFGIRAVVTAALLVVASGSGLTVFMTASWQLVLCWGVLVGLGTGSMALALVATVTGRWFVTHRGLVSGVLTAGGAAGQLVFLPLVARGRRTRRAGGWRRWGWRRAALAVAPFVVWLLRDRPSDVGVAPYGGTPEDEPPVVRIGAARVAAAGAGRRRPHQAVLVPRGRDGDLRRDDVRAHPAALRARRARPRAAASPSARACSPLVGIFDIVGTIASGWLTDRVDPRLLLLAYYVLRGFSLMALPLLFGPSVHPTMLLFVVFYGLDWVATIPPTMALVREHFGARAPVVFGWVFASHQVGAAAMALVAGIIRDRLHTYDAAWYVGGALCLVAGVLSLAVGRTQAQGRSARVVPRDHRGGARAAARGAVVARR